MSSPIRTRDLEAVIDAVVESYDGPEEINNLESAALPNKRAVVQAYNHLKPVIYMELLQSAFPHAQPTSVTR